MKLLILLPALAIAAVIPRDDPPSPSAAPTPPPQKTTHLYICVDAGFKGTCENVSVEFGRCYNLPPKFNDAISSTGPDQGTFCTAYPDYECSGKALPFVNPGIWDLAQYGYGDVISSYRCDELGGLDY